MTEAKHELAKQIGILFLLMADDRKLRHGQIAMKRYEYGVCFVFVVHIKNRPTELKALVDVNELIEKSAGMIALRLSSDFKARFQNLQRIADSGTCEILGKETETDDTKTGKEMEQTKCG